MFRDLTSGNISSDQQWWSEHVKEMLTATTERYIFKLEFFHDYSSSFFQHMIPLKGIIQCDLYNGTLNKAPNIVQGHVSGWRQTCTSITTRTCDKVSTTHNKVNRVATRCQEVTADRQRLAESDEPRNGHRSLSAGWLISSCSTTLFTVLNIRVEIQWI